MRKLGLALGLATALYANSLYADSKPKMNDSDFWRNVPDTIEKHMRADAWKNTLAEAVAREICETNCDTDKKPVPPAPEKPANKPAPSKPPQRRPSRSTPRPAPTPVYTLEGGQTDQYWCVPGMDYAVLTPPTSASGNVILERRDDTPEYLWSKVQDGRITRAEATTAFQIPLNAVLLDANGKVLKRDGRIYTVEAAYPCAAPKAPDTPMRTPPRTETPDNAKPLPNAGPHSIEVISGSFNDVVESGSYQTINGKDVFVPFNGTFSGSHSGIEYKYAQPNTAFHARYAHSTGSDNLDSDRFMRSQMNVNADSFAVQLTQAFTKWPVRPLVMAGGEIKKVSFNDSYGPFQQATFLSNSNHSWRAGLGGQAGDLNGNHAKAVIGYQQQDMTFQRPGFPGSDERRGTGVTENGLFAHVAGEAYLMNKHLHPGIEINYFQPNSQRATDQFEEYQTGNASNIRFTAGWVFNPHSKNVVELGAYVKKGIEDGHIGKDKPVPFSNSGDNYGLSLKLRF